MQADIDHKAILFVKPKIIYVLFYNTLKTFTHRRRFDFDQKTLFDFDVMLFKKIETAKCIYYRQTSIER